MRMSLQYSLVNQVLYAMDATITAKSLEQRQTHIRDRHPKKFKNSKTPSAQKLFIASQSFSLFPFLAKEQFIIGTGRTPWAGPAFCQMIDSAAAARKKKKKQR